MSLPLEVTALTFAPVHRAFVIGALISACGGSLPPPTLVQIAPTEVDQTRGGALTIDGTHLQPRITANFDRPSDSVVDAEFTVRLERGTNQFPLDGVSLVTRDELMGQVLAGVPLGVYDVRVIDPRGREAVLSNALTIIESVDAGAVDAGQSDAGPPNDAGSDGGAPPDAGPDSGVADAGADAGSDGGGCSMITYPDLDHDGYGTSAGAAVICGPTRATSSGDCDDTDPDAHPGATEICNGLDDNCDGLIDETGCPATPGWTERMDTGNTDWVTVSTWAPGAVWIAGTDKVRVLRPDAGFFQGASMQCPNSLQASWANSTGRLYLGGGFANGRLTPHNLTSMGCLVPSETLSSSVTGMVGFHQLDGGLIIVGASQNGSTFEWHPPAPPTEFPSNLSAVHINDFHGSDLDTLFGVGFDSTNFPVSVKVLRYDLATHTWRDENAADAGTQGALHGVWVMSAGEVVAVGTNGIALQKTGGRWSRLPLHPSGNAELNGVRAFNPARVYVVDGNGVISRWDQRVWSVLHHTTNALHDIAALSEDDLWVVGDNGTVLHWP